MCFLSRECESDMKEGTGARSVVQRSFTVVILVQSADFTDLREP